METNGKRNSASINSVQPTQSKKTCFPSVKQEGSGSERNLMLERCLTEDDVQRMVRVELERAKSQPAEYCQTYTGNSLQDAVQRMDSMESASQILEHGNMKKASDKCNDVEGFHGQRPRSKKQMQSSKSKTSNGLESDLLPKSFWTKEDIGRVVREQLELAKSHSPDLVESRILNTLKREVVPEICSLLEDTIRRVIREELKHAPCQSAQLVRSSGTCREKDEERNLKLQFITKLPASLYSGEKLKGECSDPFDVKLVNANTGTIVESGPESSVKLKVVVVEGGFEREDDDNWTQDEFENSVVKERKGKGPLLKGNLGVKLNRGTGVLGDVEFTDNSKCTRSGQFRIGFQAPPGHCENIREAITEAFTVKENRGKSNQKHFPPYPNDDVWRLKNIAKNGSLCKKLNKAGIYKVEEFKQQLDINSGKLRKILGEGITENKWEDLLKHANDCPLNGKPHVCHDYESDHGVGQRIGLTADVVYCAADKFSIEQKEKARELNDETFSGSMQKKRVSSSSSQVSEGHIEDVTDVQHNLAPPVNAGSPAEGRNGVTLASSVQSQNTNSGNTENSGGSSSVDMPTQPHDINSHYPLPSPMIGSWSQMIRSEPDMSGAWFDGIITTDGTSPDGNHVTAETQSTDTFGAWFDGIITTDGTPPDGNHVTAETQSTDMFGAWLDGIITTDGTPPDADTFFQTPPDADDVM